MSDVDGVCAAAGEQQCLSVPAASALTSSSTAAGDLAMHMEDALSQWLRAASAVRSVPIPHSCLRRSALFLPSSPSPSPSPSPSSVAPFQQLSPHAVLDLWHTHTVAPTSAPNACAAAEPSSPIRHRARSVSLDFAWGSPQLLRFDAMLSELLEDKLALASKDADMRLAAEIGQLLLEKSVKCEADIDALHRSLAARERELTEAHSQCQLLRRQCAAHAHNTSTSTSNNSSSSSSNDDCTRCAQPNHRHLSPSTAPLLGSSPLPSRPSREFPREWNDGVRGAAPSPSPSPVRVRLEAEAGVLSDEEEGGGGGEVCVLPSSWAQFVQRELKDRGLFSGDADADFRTFHRSIRKERTQLRGLSLLLSSLLFFSSLLFSSLLFSSLLFSSLLFSSLLFSSLPLLFSSFPLLISSPLFSSPLLSSIPFPSLSFSLRMCGVVVCARVFLSAMCARPPPCPAVSSCLPSHCSLFFTVLLFLPQPDNSYLISSST